VWGYGGARLLRKWKGMRNDEFWRKSERYEDEYGERSKKGSVPFSPAFGPEVSTAQLDFSDYGR
jgi:hypothetical protein